MGLAFDISNNGADGLTCAAAIGCAFDMSKSGAVGWVGVS